MWIVRIALTRPYTFIVLALLILILSPVMILRTPTDIFPNINIPVVSVAWQYTGMNAEELEGRLTTPYEKALTTLVDNIEHIESTTYNGEAVVKIFLQPGASLDTANAQVTAASQYMLRQLPPGTLPPEIINFSASSVPILQLGLSGQGLSEQQLNDLAMNFVRPQLVTVPGAVLPQPYGGKQRQIMINMDQGLMQAKGVSPIDVLNAVNAQNLIVPSGTAKIGESEYDVRVNAAPRTIAGLNDIPIRQVGEHDDLPARRGDGERRIRGADQRGAAGWAARRADFGAEGGKRFDAGCREGHSRDAAAGGINGTAAVAHDAAGGPVDLCARSGERRDPRRQ